MQESHNPINKDDLEKNLLKTYTRPGTPLPKAPVTRCNTKQNKQAIWFTGTILFSAGFVALIRYLASTIPSDVGCTQQHNGMDFMKAIITKHPDREDTLSCLYTGNTGNTGNTTTVTKQYDALDPNGSLWHNSGPNIWSCNGTTAESTETDASKCLATLGYEADDD